MHFASMEGKQKLNEMVPQGCEGQAHALEGQ